MRSLKLSRRIRPVAPAVGAVNAADLLWFAATLLRTFVRRKLPGSPRNDWRFSSSRPSPATRSGRGEQLKVRRCEAIRIVRSSPVRYCAPSVRSRRADGRDGRRLGSRGIRPGGCGGQEGDEPSVDTGPEPANVVMVERRISKLTSPLFGRRVETVGAQIGCRAIPSIGSIRAHTMVPQRRFGGPPDDREPPRPPPRLHARRAR